MSKRKDALEEAVLREHYQTVTPKQVNLWPGVRRGIEASAQAKPVRRLTGRRLGIAITCALITMAFLAGMASYRHFVYRSDGSRTKLSEDGVYTDENGMHYRALEGQFDQSGITYDYDWKNRISIDEENGAFRYVTENYEAFCALAGENRLGVRLPKLSAIPPEYSQRPYFAATYYLTPHDRAQVNETGALPQELSRQIGRYELKWFKETKEPFTFSCMPCEEIESWINYFTLSDDPNVSFHPVEIEGFEKAFVKTIFNTAFEEYETDLHLFEKIDPVEIAADYDAFPVLNGEGDILTANYMSYLVQTVGLTEEEVIEAVLNAFS